jgi:hypothetical protein
MFVHRRHIYRHLTSLALNKVKSPFDKLKINAAKSETKKVSCIQLGGVRLGGYAKLLAGIRELSARKDWSQPTK